MACLAPGYCVERHVRNAGLPLQAAHALEALPLQCWCCSWPCPAGLIPTLDAPDDSRGDADDGSFLYLMPATPLAHGMPRSWLLR